MVNITELVESPGYKKLMGKVYGWGAALVLAGALFKIMHFPGAGPMLVIGMGVEIIIFFLSAFEPPHAMPDWSLVYPELVGLEATDRGHGTSKAVSGGSDLAALIQSGHLEGDVVQKLSEGIKKLANTTGQLSTLSEASLATDHYLKNMQTASESISHFSAAQAKATHTLDQSSINLANSYDSTAKALASSGARLVDDINKSGEQLTTTYGKLAQSVATESDRITSNGKLYFEQLSGMTKNLGDLNAMYELQVKNSSAQAKASAEVVQGLETIKGQFMQSVDDVRSYREQVGKLSQSIGELNSIYGNMLSAMNVGNR